VDTTSVLPCAVEKTRELERREGAVTVLIFIEEPTVVDTVYAFVNRLETTSVDAMPTVLMMSNPPSSVETVSGFV
jgi:hypothetical protein